jgi:uncharacterized repeat protein (TIGR03803 family)
MTKPAQHLGWISGIRRRAASAAVALAAVLGLAVVATQSAHGQTYKVLYSFKGQVDGGYSYAGVVLDAKGNLYGTTYYGGTGPCYNQYIDTYGCGKVFKVSPSGKETVLYSFTDGTDGGYPEAPVTIDSSGNLYGTTSQGGIIGCYASDLGCGAVFKLDAAGRVTVLHTFTGATDGGAPNQGVVRDGTGTLYGTTYNGGDASCYSYNGTCGTVFKINTSGKETVLHSFTGSPDGTYPFAGILLRDKNGNLYGTTQAGGGLENGTVYKVDTTGKETVLFNKFSNRNGIEPQGNLARDANGNLYGTTTTGGTGVRGVVFRLDTTGKVTVLHSFTGSDGETPLGGVIRDAKGNLYGTTQTGGAKKYFGTVFKLDTTGKLTVLHSFTGRADGAEPYGALIQDASGNLYGTTSNGGNLTACGGGGCGVVFKLTP